MSVHTKKHPIKRPVITLEIEGKKHVYQNVPISQVSKLLEFLSAFPPCESVETLEKIPFEDAYKDHFAKIGGEVPNQYSAHAVRTCRKENGFTQTVLAELLGTDQAHISNIERARKPVGKRLAKKLAQIFTKYEPSFFLSGI